MRAIIPCAGYGTRVGMKPEESKEMLLSGVMFSNDYESSRNISFIEDKILMCECHELDPLVITRKEKTDLITFCKERQIETLIIEPTKTWADTVLASKRYWQDTNILILPDTTFNSSVISKMKNPNPVTFALHSVEDVSQWGQVTDDYFSEKPKVIGPGNAWGLISFTRTYGEFLFENMRWPGFQTPLLKEANFVRLTHFEDPTREPLVLVDGLKNPDTNRNTESDNPLVDLV